MSEPLHAGELRALLNDPGVQHLLPPNWKDRVVAQVDRLTEALGECNCYPGGFTPDTYEGPQEACPQHGRPYAEWVERAERAEADLAAAKRRRAERDARLLALADEWEQPVEGRQEYATLAFLCAADELRALLDTATEETGTL